MIRNRVLCFLALMLTLCVAFASALAENSAGVDLAARFGKDAIEYNGERYTLRNRVDTVVLLGVLEDETGTERADFIACLFIDDNQKSVVPLRIPAETMMIVNGEAMEIGDIYSIEASRHNRCKHIVAAVNAMFDGESVIEHYIAFELKGLKAIEGYVPAEGNAEQQMRSFYASAELQSSQQVKDMYSKLAEYIISDMKSGGVMKVADRCDRYARPHMANIPMLGTEEGSAYSCADVKELLQKKIELLYEKALWG